MSVIVPRTCTEVSDTDRNQPNESQPLDAFRSKPAYVLLGDPGSGKTTAFQAESKAVDDAYFISARDFLTLNMDSHPKWREKTLFIDGLDEVRVGKTDVRTPFDAIRERLDTLGKPRFRLSCREADWLGTNDLDHLVSVTPDGAVTVLRLDPLTDEDIIKILDAQPGVDDTQKFIEKARERGVDGLLKNPQSLELLVKAVADGGWPENRLDTFERACRQMVRELNDEHQAARREAETSSPDQLLDAAGRLCAVQLIAGIVGYTVGLGEPDSAYPSPEERGDDIERGVYKAALTTTKLFRGSDNHFTPVHRHIAEFLGARHLAQLIDKELPSQRVLALITGEDGGVVTEMRGLSAWLAAQCLRTRMALIERDPIGVGLYGDLHQFSHDEKCALLVSLEQTLLNSFGHGFALDDFLGSAGRMAAAFGVLATPDMEPALESILIHSNREKKHQFTVFFVLHVLRQGAVLPGLAEPLVKIVRDDTWPVGIREQGLKTFIHVCNGRDETNADMKALLEDIHSGEVSDPEDQLLGILLTYLYPDALSASRVFEHLQESETRFFGKYFRFWNISLVENSSDNDVCELLDALVTQGETLRPILESRRLHNMPMGLLARGLEAYGDGFDTRRLYDWLGVGLSSDLRSPDHVKEVERIRSWLEQRPNVQKTLISEGLNRYAESHDGSFNSCMYSVMQHLYGAKPPNDFWCLEQTENDFQIAEYLIKWAINRWGFSPESLKNCAYGNERLQNKLMGVLNRLDQEDAKYRELSLQSQKYDKEEGHEHQEWLNYVRSNQVALRENRAAPTLLHELAETYIDPYKVSHENGPEALRQLLRNDQGLIDAALQGLRGVVNRSDIPDVKEIISLYRKNRRHYLSLPILVSLAELERTAPEELGRLDEHQFRIALTFFYCTPHGDPPEWYRQLLEARPQVVAAILIEFAISELHSDREYVYGLQKLTHDLARDQSHAQVARLASLPLLYAFPVRCKSQHIEALDNLLWAAIQHADSLSLQKMIKRKLSLTSMNVTQRVYWLAVGVTVSPGAYKDRLKDFVQSRENRIRHVVEFFSNKEITWCLSDEVGISVLKLLVRLVGSYTGPIDLSSDEFFTTGGRASGFARSLIQRLAAVSTKEASDALEALRSDPVLKRWHDELSRAQASQRIIRRDAEYRHPDIEQVRATLQNGPPANASDLAALVTDRLREIAGRIRTGNTNDWRQYWNEDSHGRPQEPKPENSCRDALLSTLRNYLPRGVEAQPEGQYANDTRADIRVSCANFNVPIEIKKSSHRDVWSAMRSQLIAKYTRDPDASGYGIYLVFWFGLEGCPPGSDGRPKSAADLEKKLCETLSPDEARRISVCVIDVARP